MRAIQKRKTNHQWKVFYPFVVQVSLYQGQEEARESAYAFTPCLLFYQPLVPLPCQRVGPTTLCRLTPLARPQPGRNLPTNCGRLLARVVQRISPAACWRSSSSRDPSGAASQFAGSRRMLERRALSTPASGAADSNR